MTARKALVDISGRIQELPAGDSLSGVASVFGSDKQIAFNDGGTEAGSATLTWDKTTTTLALNGITNLGDGGSTNYIGISATGVLTLHGSASLPVAAVDSNSDQMILAGQIFS